MDTIPYIEERKDPAETDTVDILAEGAMSHCIPSPFETCSCITTEDRTKQNGKLILK
jgi:hypothetical protein